MRRVDLGRNGADMTEMTGRGWAKLEDNDLHGMIVIHLIEIGDQEMFGFVARALDHGGLAFEDDKPDTLAEALAALEKGLKKWFEEQGEDLE